MIIAAIVAHEGGWDEIMLVAAPIVVIVGLLAVVKRRVAAQPTSDADELTSASDPASRPATRDPGRAP